MKFTCDMIAHKSASFEMLFSCYGENRCLDEMDAIGQCIEKAELMRDDDFYTLEIELFSDESDMMYDKPLKQLEIPFPCDIVVDYITRYGWFHCRMIDIYSAMAYKEMLEKDGCKAEIVFEPATD